MPWTNQFPADYAPPASLLQLCESGVLKDISWGNDACPSFLGRASGERFVRIWSDHPIPDLRETRGPRYMVVECDPEGCHDDHWEVMYEGDDVAEVVALLVGVA